MRTEEVHTVILGAGPAGLAAGYVLAKAGKKPVVLERDKVPGGLMRSIKRGDFIVDVGRKELYNRLEKVDLFWSELLGDQYQSYPHRGGILFDGHIIDISPSFRGFRRGMPWSMFLACAADLAWSRARANGHRASNLEEYFYQKRGGRLTRIISQGFQEKLSGIKWADVNLPDDYSDERDSSVLITVKELAVRTFSKKESNTFKGIWRHPTKGTGQICEMLERGIVNSGGKFVFQSNLLEIGSSGGLINEVKVGTTGETFAYRPQHVISSIPAQVLLKLLLKERFETLDSNLKAPVSSKKTIVLVYLFLNEKPRFPHGWLNVTCPKMRMGRVTNYSGINQAMVPKGKTSLCCEFYCYGEDRLLALDNQAFVELALDECSKYKLLDRTKCFDHLVLRFQGADASQNRHNWMNNMRMGLIDELKPFKNLYYAARTDLDIATLAGLESAEAILSGDRTAFDRHVDPRELGIRSTRKAFEFKNPAEQGV